MTASRPPQHAPVSDADERYQEAYEVVADAVASCFGAAQPAFEWGMPMWRIMRDPAKVPPREDWKGTYAYDSFGIGLADRKAGPTLHVWHPGAYHLLDDNAAWLSEAGFKVMVGCLPWSRKAPYPRDAVERLMDAVRSVDE